MDDDQQEQEEGQDARVRTLTAEVRTLVVGSRQVTMSVYNQLDFVDYAQIKPFGRVNPKDADSAALYVVGRHKADGSLVRARTPRVSDEFDDQPHLAAARVVTSNMIDGIRSADQEARGAVIREAMRAFARLIHSHLADRSKVVDFLQQEARSAGLPSGHIRADIDRHLTELFAGSFEGKGGPFEGQAILVVDDREKAYGNARVAVAKVKVAWSGLPLIVLAGLR